MSWQVEWAPPAVHDLRRLDEQGRQRVYAAVQQFATTGHGDVRRLSGTKREWRLRVGDWRVIFTYPEPGVLRVLHVHPRGRAYRD